MADDNTAVGVNALGALPTGTKNVAVGSKAGATISSGTQNVVIGYNTAPGLTSNSGNIIIGAGQDVSPLITNNYLNIGGAINGDMSIGFVSAGVSKAPCNYATTTALPANTYNNGTSGVGATLTANANGALTVDGSSVSAGQRILVWQEGTAANNGIYVVTNAGGASAKYVLTRAADFDNSSRIVPGARTYVQSGTIYANSNFQMTTVTTVTAITVGTTNLTFQGTAGNIFASGMVVLMSGTFDSSVNTVIDFSSTVPNDVYTKLIMEIWNVAGNGGTTLYIAFVNQGTTNTGSIYTGVNNYGAGSGRPTLPYSSNAFCGDSGEQTADGSATIELRGFCRTLPKSGGNTIVMPNLLVSSMTYTAAGGYFDSSLGNIGCSNGSNQVFDGLAFIDSNAPTNKHTFSWKLYGIV